MADETTNMSEQERNDLAWRLALSAARGAREEKRRATNDQREAVCGTCGVPVENSIHHGGGTCPFCGVPRHIPAPVVPSDERLCVCGDVEAVHRDRGANYLRGACYAVECECKSFNPAPPTPSQDAHAHVWVEVGGSGPYCHVCGQFPSRREVARNSSPRPQRATSQDAEGDGLERARKLFIGNWLPAGVHRGDEWIRSDLAVVESAIRAPYEDLVTAAQGVNAVVEILNSGQTVLPFGEESATLDAALARLAAALESLGGRS